MYVLFWIFKCSHGRVVRKYANEFHCFIHLVHSIMVVNLENKYIRSISQWKGKVSYISIVSSIHPLSWNLLSSVFDICKSAMYKVFKLPKTYSSQYAEKERRKKDHSTFLNFHDPLSSQVRVCLTFVLI